MAEEQERAKKNRSPEYPGLDLPTSIQRAEELYEHEAFNWTSPEVAAGHWHYSPSSSGGRRSLAALKHFGLLEDTGANQDRRVRLTDLARRIIRDKREGSVDRVKAIREAALKPTIYEALWTTWGSSGRLPSRSTMQYELEHKFSFNPNVIESFITDFLASLEFAGLDKEAAGATSAGPLNRESEAQLEEIASPLRPARAEQTDVLELPIPLMSGKRGSLHVPVPLTEQDYTLLTTTIQSLLTVMKPALVRAPSAGVPVTD